MQWKIETTDFEYLQWFLSMAWHHKKWLAKYE
jgi:hypothetical protein